MPCHDPAAFPGCFPPPFEQVLAGHTNKVIKDLSHREAAKSVAKFFQNQEIKDAISETMGPEYVDSLMPWLKGTVNDAGVQADLRGVQRRRNTRTGTRSTRVPE